MAFPVFGEEDAAQIRMTGEANAEKVENLALEPVGARPNRDKRIHDSIAAGESDAETNLVAPRDGDEVVVHFETRLKGKTVDAGGVREKIKLQRDVFAASRGGGAQKLGRNNDGRLAAKLDYLGDGFRIPRAQMFDHNISALFGALRHSFRHSFRKSRRGLFMPVECALFPKIEITDQQDGDV
jgi:hypothetical protein